MTYLVAGANRVDAGKTTFTVGLVDQLGTTGFKPRGGNDYWFDHDDYRTAIDEGRLHGKDARRLAAASASAIEPEKLNPIHRLWRPAPGGDGFIGRPGRQFVLDRVGEGYVVNEGASVPRTAREALPLADAPRVATVAELNAQIESRHLPQLEALGRRIAEHDRPVVESYGDVARPLRSIEPDRVAVVEPGRARIYDGPRYWNACEVAGGSPVDGQLEERVSDVTALIEPLTAVELPPLTAAERGSPPEIAAAYREAYDELLAPDRRVH